MKWNFFYSIFFLILSLNLFAQSEKQTIPSKIIRGKEIQKFVDSLKIKILNDTVKFNEIDLININGITKNTKSYSSLITINFKYDYKLDIIENNLVIEFCDAILNSNNIESINCFSDDNATLLRGSIAENGWILITLKPKTKLNFEVGGLKYKKGKKRKGGNNLLQRKTGQVMIRT